MWTELAAAAFGIGAYAWFIEPRRIRRRALRLDLPGPSLPGPLRVLHLTDLHFFNGQTYRRDAIHRAAGEDYDFVFITGDLIDDDSGIDLCIEALRPLKARHGAFCVLGNHDYVYFRADDLFPAGSKMNQRMWVYNDSERLIAELRGIGITVLRNELARVDIDGGALQIAGVDDPYLGRDDIEKTFEGYDPSLPGICLVHAPERYDEVCRSGVQLVLCGHTHGGQICIPGFRPPVTRTTAPIEFADGMTRLNGAVHFVSNGLGSGRVTRPRFWRPPEYVAFELNFGKNDR